MLFFFTSDRDPCHTVSQCLVPSPVCPGYLSSGSRHKFGGFVRINVSSGLLSRCKFCITDFVVPKLDRLWVLFLIGLWLFPLVSKRVNQTWYSRVALWYAYCLYAYVISLDIRQHWFLREKKWWISICKRQWNKWINHLVNFCPWLLDCSL